MKSKLFFLGMLALMVTSSNAQFHLGIKGGTNVTKVEGKSFTDEFSYGYLLGGFAELKLSKQLFLQPEVQISRNTMSLDSIYNNVYVNAWRGLSAVKMEYLTIPILLNYKFGGGFVSLQAGPQFGILFDKNNSFGQNAQNAFKKGDLSMLGGIQLKAGIFRINGRYVIGLSDLNDLTNDSKWKSQGFQLAVGMALL